MRLEWGVVSLAVAGVAVAVIAWFAAPGPPAVNTGAREPERWQLPQPAKGPSPQMVDALAKAPLWGNLPAGTGSAEAIDPAWRFIGIGRRGDDKFVLIKVAGQPERRLAINDELPGGSRIVEISDDSLCILINGNRRKLAIHGTGAQAL